MNVRSKLAATVVAAAAIAAAGSSAAVVPAAGSAVTPPPNVIVLLSDDQSYSSIPKWPYLASRTGWYRFSNAYDNNATCCPSRATILTGQWSHHHGVEATGGAPRFDDSNTVACWLAAAGYRTGLVGKYHLGSTANVPTTFIPPCWSDTWVEHEINDPDCAGECPYYNYTLNVNGTHVRYGSAPADYSTTVETGFALDFIARNAERQPFFLVFSPRSPHDPWTAAPGDVGHYSAEPVVDDPSWNEADMSDKPAWWRALPLKQKNNTDGARRKEWDTGLSFDRAVRQIVSKVNELNLMGNTAIFFLTDNGFSYGEHRWSGKVCAYDPCSKTPLLVKYKGGSQGWTFPQLVGNEDLAPTIADLAGIAPGGLVDGDSFAPFLRTGAAPPTWPNEVLLHGFNGANGGAGDPPGAGHPPTYWSIRVPGFKYVETPSTGETELYDLTVDPYELLNQAANPVYETTRATLAARLAELRARPPR